MTDRELLELAAKAAGIKHRKGDYEKGLDTNNGFWNPLTDDGDALRLAVKLQMLITIGSEETYITANGMMVESEEFFDENNNDPYAATRRAIVRAAAEIGKTK